MILTCNKCFSSNSAIFIFLLAIVGVFYPYNRGALFTALVVIYALTSGIAGYTATSFYLQLEGTNWVRLALVVGFFNEILCCYVDKFCLNVSGGKSDIDWLLVLWATFLDILLLKHCCDSVQCYSSFAFWYYHCHYSHLGTCNLSSPSAGWYSWEK